MNGILGSVVTATYAIARAAHASGVGNFLSSIAQDAVKVARAPLTLYEMHTQVDEVYKTCMADANAWQGTLGFSALVPAYKTLCEGYRYTSVALGLGSIFAAYKVYPYAKSSVKNTYKLIKGFFKAKQAYSLIADIVNKRKFPSFSKLNKLELGQFNQLNSLFSHPLIISLIKAHPSLTLSKFQYEVNDKNQLVFEFKANEVSLKVLKNILTKELQGTITHFTQSKKTNALTSLTAEFPKQHIVIKIS